ncbi:MAG: 4Fe-4S dicluster domain-containing protein [Chloroflexota bacterium]|nr:MAG: 4Fe-4S dicluster domain-containing protein [Chloroflexota bacterium]
MDTVKLTIDERTVEVKKGTSVLEAAEQAGIYIPHLCFVHGLKPYVGCRLCAVEIEGARGLELSCAEPVRDGMIVRTNTPKVLETRRNLLEVIISEHPWKCLTCWRRERCNPLWHCQRDAKVTDRCVMCPRNRDCELQRVVDFVNMRQDDQPFYAVPKTQPIRWKNPFLQYDPNKCILCTRCVRVCAERRHVGALELSHRGYRATISTAFGEELDCEFCGACAEVCPTGAIMEKSRRYTGVPDVSVPTVCGHCGVGCGLQIDVKNGKIIGVTAPESHAVNGNDLCVRGKFGFGYIQSESRLKTPLVKGQPAVNGTAVPVSWEEAIGQVADRLYDIREHHGPDAIAFVGSSRLTNEEGYLLQKLARGLVGTNNVDQAASMFHRGTLDGLGARLGVGAMTNSLADLEKAGCIVVVGNNTANTHPIAALKIKNAVKNHGAKLIVAHPLRTDLDRFATLSLHYKPGSEVALLKGLAAGLLSARGADLEQTAGYADLRASLQGSDAAAVATQTGVASEALQQASKILSEAAGETSPAKAQAGEEKPLPLRPSKPIVLVYGSGLSYAETPADVAAAVANLAVLLDAAGAQVGVAALAADANLQGSCDMGMLPDYLPGRVAIQDDAARARIAHAWLGAQGQLPSKRGLGFREMLEAARNGKLKAMVVVGDDPVTSIPDTAYVSECLTDLPLLVVIDVTATPTAQLADVVLPGVSFAEKAGTFTSTERRVQKLRPAIDPIGDARPEWWVLGQLGKRLAARLGGAAKVQLEYEGPKAIMDEIGALVPTYAGISYDRLEEGGLQWPCPSATSQGTADVLDQANTRLVAVQHESSTAPAASDYPFLLVTEKTLFSDLREPPINGRNLLQVERTDFAELNPVDAVVLGIQSGDRVRVVSPAGSVVARAVWSDRVEQGQVLVPSGVRSEVNGLLKRNGAFVRASRVTVRIEKAIELPVER